MLLLKYKLNGLWLQTNVADPYTIGSLVKGYCATRGVSVIQVFLGDELVIAIEK